MSGVLRALDVLIHVEPAVVFAADVRSLLPTADPAAADVCPAAAAAAAGPEPEPEPAPMPEGDAAQSGSVLAKYSKDSDGDGDGSGATRSNRDDIEQLCTFVSADLDSNLLFRLRLGQHCLAAAQAPAVQEWIKERFPHDAASRNDASNRQCG
jgi:hypothetical protein